MAGHFSTHARTETKRSQWLLLAPPHIPSHSGCQGLGINRCQTMMSLVDENTHTIIARNTLPYYHREPSSKNPIYPFHCTCIYFTLYLTFCSRRLRGSSHIHHFILPFPPPPPWQYHDASRIKLPSLCIVGPACYVSSLSGLRLLPSAFPRRITQPWESVPSSLYLVSSTKVEDSLRTCYSFSSIPSHYLRTRVSTA
ncbi:hypothetical protein LZ32DRAFT_264143 [Colletotrichum eremochloae]|nr:hypothetical protein LZ32DRAFT_264143 [Colletotrichum eremochloae]